MRQDFNGLGKSASYTDVLYFVSTTLSTVGYGDIYPITQRSKILVIFLQLTLIIDLLSVLFG